MAVDAQQTIGRIVDETAQRDAVHFALLPAQATELLLPGQKVSLVGDSGKQVKFDESRKAIGIVDPFLGRAVESGEWFWVMLMPNTVTSLRHQWTHASIPEEDKPLDERAAAELRLRAFCDQGYDSPSYDALLEAVRRHAGYDYLTIHGDDAHGPVPRQVWEDACLIVGRDTNGAPESFSCSC